VYYQMVSRLLLEQRHRMLTIFLSVNLRRWIDRNLVERYSLLFGMARPNSTSCTLFDALDTT
jgi:hypothetical protein